MNTPSLYELQKEFVNGLDSHTNTILQYIQPDNRFVSLTIYRNSMIGTLQKSLQSIYQVCCKLVGQEFFIAMIEPYILQTHSLSADLADFGADFADFIEHFIPVKHLYYLADVARLEWAWHRIHHAPKSLPFDFQKLSACYALSGNQIIFQLPPQSFLLASPYPIHQIWEINQHNVVNHQTITLENDTLYYLFVWNNQLNMRIDTLSYAQWQLLSWIQMELSLGDICDKIALTLVEMDITLLLPHLIQQGWLSDFR